MNIKGRGSARRQVATSAVIGVLAGGAVAATGVWELVPLTVWDTAAVVYMVRVWAGIWPADGPRTAALAAQQDPSTGAADLVLLLAAVASLLGVGIVLMQGAAKGNDVSPATGVGVGITSVVISWALVHTVYTLRYARLYYGGQQGGISFNQDPPPRYSDFAYLAFTIGMTFQVSDTDLQTSVIRATALRHALLSYLFGAFIIATTINLIAGLSK